MNIILPQLRRSKITSKSLISEDIKSLPFPLVPVSPEENGESRPGPIWNVRWKTFHAFYENRVVTVKDFENARILWNNGYFGEGSLAKSRLDFSPNEEICVLKSDAIPEGRETEEQCQARPMKASDSSYKPKERLMKKGVSDLEETDVLRLCFEEAFFLSFGFGCLVMSDMTGKMLNINEMWLAFFHTDKAFPFLYIVYHHFRSKGWVVKNGLKFGADFTLYPGSPREYHSQYLLWIQCLWDDTLENDYTGISRKTSLEDISAFTRLSNQTSKNGLICQLIRPRCLSDDDLKSPECIHKFKLNNTVLQRWVIGGDSCGGEPPSQKPNG